MKNLTRRNILTTGLGFAGALGLTARGPASTARAAVSSRPSKWTQKTSANGWAVTSHDGIIFERVEGSSVNFAVCSGAPAIVLAYVARRFAYEIDSALKTGDITGHSSDRDIDASFESNYLSGTAIAIRPGSYPLGAKDGLFPHELVVVRDILAECEGTVRWGGDEPTPKESHFQIDVGPEDQRLKVLAAKISQWDRSPGKGAGAVDAFLPSRRRAARDMERRQAA